MAGRASGRRHTTGCVIRATCAAYRGRNSRSSSAASVAARATPLMLKGSVTARTASSDCGWPIRTPDAHAGQTVRLRERPADQHVRVARQTRQKRLAAELDVRLVDEHDRLRRGFGNPLQIGDRDQLSGRIVRRVEEDHPRARRDRREHLVGLKREVRARAVRAWPWRRPRPWSSDTDRTLAAE